MEALKGLSCYFPGFGDVFLEILLMDRLVQSKAEPENMTAFKASIHLLSRYLVANFRLLSCLLSSYFRTLRDIAQKISLCLVVKDLNLCIVVISLK